MTFAAAERIADAVLYEGYVLYPYRASSAKNRVRWQFGVLAPRPPVEEDGEPWFSQTDCLVAAADRSRLSVRVRCLRVRPRNNSAPEAGAWLEGAPQAIDIGPLDLCSTPSERDTPLRIDGIAARLLMTTEVSGPSTKVRLRLENLEPWSPEFAEGRDLMLQHSLVGAHLVLALDGGEFVSLLDPPPEAAAAVAECKNRHTWPVLVGDRTRRDLMLSSPILLYDYPAVAPESPGDLCDGAEIDEILSLRIMTLTDDEKREARATDPRAREIIDRVDALAPDALAALHGTMRSADFFNPPDTPTPDAASVMVGDVRVAKGARVRLRPSRRADAMDMFLRDQAATVAGVYRDVDDRVYVAVTVDADPAAQLHESFGRFFYFDPDEVEPIEQEQI